MNRERKEQQRMEEAEQRERDFVKERDAFMAGMNDDESFLALKEARADLTRWQQDLTESIKLLEYDLLNYVKNGDKWEPQLVYVGVDPAGREVWEEMKPMVNKLGVSRIISTTKRYLDRNFMMSNLNQDVILRMLRRLKTDLVMNLGAKFEEYEIDPQDLSLLVKMIINSVEATLYRALNNGERTHLNTINKRVEAFTETNKEPIKQRQKGLMGMMS